MENEGLLRVNESLLLFLEICMVDDWCKVDTRHMNKEEMELANKWAEEGFIYFGRIPAKALNPQFPHKTHFVVILPDALRIAEQLRFERALRQIPKIANILRLNAFDKYSGVLEDLAKRGLIPE